MNKIRKFYNTKILIISLCLYGVYIFVCWLYRPEICWDGFDESSGEMIGGCDPDWESFWFFVWFGFGIFIIGYAVLMTLFYFIDKKKR